MAVPTMVGVAVVPTAAAMGSAPAPRAIPVYFCKSLFAAKAFAILLSASPAPFAPLVTASPGKAEGDAQARICVLGARVYCIIRRDSL